MSAQKYLVVGQGLAGTLVTHQLLKHGHTVRVVDAGHQHASTAVAAGIMNPFTGRNFVKSWMVDELFPKAFEVYRELETLLGERFLFPKDILRVLPDIKTENDFMARADLGALSPYIQALTPDIESRFENTFQDYHAIARFAGGGQCDIGHLVAVFRQFLKEKDLILEKAFDYAETPTWLSEGWQIIFCEGYGASQNPYMAGCPLSPNKGEALLVKIQDYPLDDYLVKHDVFVVPMPQTPGQYWLGSIYDNHFDDTQPSEQAREAFMLRLRGVLKKEVEVVSHRAAIRPASKHRKPFMGTLPSNAKLHYFNGLGTKGTSLGPYFAELFVSYLLHGTPLPAEVSKAFGAAG